MVMVGNPAAATDVIFSAAGATNETSTLDANFTIHSLTINDPAPVAISNAAGQSFTLTVAGNAGSGITVNAGANLTLNSNVVLGGNSDTIVVNGTGVAAINGVLSGKHGLIKTGGSTLTLGSGGNHYNGATRIQDGTLTLTADHALPSGSAITVNGPAGTGNAVLDLNGHRQTVHNLTLVAPIGAGQSTIDVHGGVLTLAGNVSVINGTAAPGNNFNPLIEDGVGGGGLDLGNATRTFTIASQNLQTEDLMITAVIQGKGGVVINASPSTFNGTEGGIVFGAANTYTGSTTVAQGRLTLLGDGRLPSKTNLILGTANSALTGDVDISGSSQFVNSIAVAAGNTGGAGNFITSLFGGGTLTVSSTTTSSIFRGLIAGSLELDKDGAGTTLTLTGANSYTNGTVLKNGTLRTQNALALGSGPVTLLGGTLQAKGPLNVDSLVWAGARISLAPARGDVINSASTFLNGAGGGAFIIDTKGLKQTTYTLATFSSPTNFTVDQFTATPLNGYASIDGKFVLGPSASVQLTIFGVDAAGPILQNSGPGGIPAFADFTVDGAVTTGGPADSNTVSTLTFLPGGALTIFHTLNVTNGPVNLVAGSSIDLESASLAVNQLRIQPGGFLGGNGSVLGNVFNAGTISPGHSPGQIHISGNYTQAPSGLLRIEIGGRDLSRHDLLSVGGAANLGGTLQLVRLDHFRLKRDQAVTFLTANEGVSGRFGTVLNDFVSSTILEPTVVYHQNSVALEAVEGSFEKFAGQWGLSPNEKSVAHALDRAAQDRRIASLFEYLDNRRLNKLPSDFDRIAPEELTSFFAISTALANVQSQNIQRRTDDIRSGSSGFSAAGFAVNGSVPGFSGAFGITTGAAGPSGREGKGLALATPVENRWGVFLSGTGEWVSVGDTENARGYDLSSGGFTLGVDYKVSPNFAVGLMAGYTGTTADLADRGRVWVNGGKIGLYATAFAGGWYADAAVTGGYNSFDSRRSALQGEARGSTDGGELNVLFGTGYDFKAGGVNFGPIATFNDTNGRTNGFTETGSLAPLHIHGGSADSLRSALGLKASYDWKAGGVLIRPEIRAAWQHEYGDSTSTLDSDITGSGDFTSSGPRLGRDSALIGAGIAVQINERCSTYFYYDGELGRRNYQSNSVTGGLRYAF